MFKQILSAMFLTIFYGNSHQLNFDITKNIPAGIEENGIAVLELFTSEGCSSCPAADRLAIRLQQQYGNRLVVLEFHVDYWDRLGWKDPFSDPAYTQRQWNYGDKFHLRSIYTPQAVINGLSETVGSDEPGLTSLIDKALKEPSVNLLEAGASVAENNQLNIKWKYAGTKEATIHFALIQKQAITVVKAGENQGRKLPHSNIVREFLSVKSLSTNKSIHLKIPAGLSKSDIEVVGFVEQGDRIASAIVLEIL